MSAAVPAPHPGLRHRVHVRHPTQHYRWTLELAAPPAALWPLVSNTDRFNRDCGYPPVLPVARAPGAPWDPNVRRLRTRVLGIPIEWDESAFEWTAPQRFGVERRYWRGPVAEMIVTCELAENANGGTTLNYDIRITPAWWIGRFALRYSIGIEARAKMTRVFRQYDAFALQGRRRSALARRATFAASGRERLRVIGESLVREQQQPAALVAQLGEFIATADDRSLTRIRPYALADEWRTNRRDTLALFLFATRAGMVDFSWDLVCPHCRGPQNGESTLAAVSNQAHCPSCNTDFTANFAQSVELTFRPNPAIRVVPRAEFCVGGPQVTPHIIAQQRIPASSIRAVPLVAAPGRYRVRSPQTAAQRAFRIAANGEPDVTIDLGSESDGEPVLAPAGTLRLLNPVAEPRLGIVEHLAWTDQATTAAEVTSLQLFRDLFSREVLRPGEQIMAGAMTVVFTDLKDSTRLYQQIGDAPAFGRVLTHFEMLRAAVAAEDGCVVKTMGDAIMAVFPRAVQAVEALSRAQRWLAQPTAGDLPEGLRARAAGLEPFALKCGIHSGPCLAINQNDRLDYFGTTVNIAARLCGHSTGADLVLSETVASDPEVAARLAARASAPERERVQLKGFGPTAFAICRLSTAAPAHASAVETRATSDLGPRRAPDPRGLT